MNFKPPIDMDTDDANSLGSLDQATDAIVREPLDEQLVASAAGRVWQRLHSAAAPVTDASVGSPIISGCAGFQALMPAFVSGALEPAYRLLVEHHSRECVACRRALARVRKGGDAAVAPVTSSGDAVLTSSGAPRWALAAGLGAVLVATFGLWRLTAPTATQTQVRSIAGALQRVGGNNETLAAGQRFASGEVVRTATGSRAVLELEDGSQVEMGERSEVKLERRRSGLVLDLVRGGVIVEAAKQAPSSRLFVRTGDCTVAVTGTIFSVSHGAKGSRVSVIEGEVEVEGGTGLARRGLRPGEQWTTRADLVRVPLDREIAWSHNAASYRHRLEALHTISREIDQAMTVAGRTSTRLLDVMPADTVVYLAAPNVSDSLGDAWDRLQDRLADDPELRAWWDQHFSATKEPGADQIDTYLDELRALGAELGPEVAVSLGIGTIQAGADPTGEPAPPVLAAEVLRPASFSATLDAEIERLNARAGDHLVIRRITAPTGAGEPDELLVWLHDDVLLASPDGTRLAAVAAALGSGGRSAFAGTPFHAKIAAIYDGGAGWVAAVDVSRFVGDEAASAQGRLGVADLDSVVFNSRSAEGTEDGGGSQHAAVFEFSGERRGIASWLAAPAPVGALDFVSPEASFAAAGVFKDPDEMLADALAVASSNEGSGWRDMDNERLISLREDLAAALGGDVAFAIDGPWLPQPSWKLAIEVYDRDRLHGAIEALVREWNRSGEGHSAELSEEEVNGRVVYRIAGIGAAGGSIHFLYKDGYVVAGPNRALLLEAVTQRAAGISLVHASKFTALLPRDHEVHFSAVVYQDLGAAGSALADWMAQNQNLSSNDREAMQSLVASGGPGLVVAYGGSERVEIVGRSEQGLLGLSFRRLLDISSLARRDDDETAEAPAAASRIRAAARRVA